MKQKGAWISHVIIYLSSSRNIKIFRLLMRKGLPQTIARALYKHLRRSLNFSPNKLKTSYIPSKLVFPCLLSSRSWQKKNKTSIMSLIKTNNLFASLMILVAVFGVAVGDSLVSEYNKDYHDVTPNIFEQCVNHLTTH